MPAQFWTLILAKRISTIGVLAFLPVLCKHSLLAEEKREPITVASTIDGVKQPCFLALPDGLTRTSTPAPLLVILHSWSAGVEQTRPKLQALALRRGWICLFPHFRGANKHPDACGSKKAQQDILDAVAWVQKRYPVDARRIYLTGVSGGGHMTMLMAGRHPEIWAAASAWVGISDLRSWHQKHEKTRYGRMLRACCGGAPGKNAVVDKEYRERSPLTYLHRAIKVPLDIAAGVHDGIIAALY